jgi:hypothetical protein
METSEETFERTRASEMIRWTTLIIG